MIRTEGNEAVEHECAIGSLCTLDVICHPAVFHEAAQTGTFLLTEGTAELIAAPKRRSQVLEVVQCVQVDLRCPQSA